MPDNRTPEIRQADEDLLAAIEAVVRLRAATQDQQDDQLTPSDPATMVVTEFVVTAAVTSFELQEHNATQYFHIARDSGQGPDSAPHHVTLGLATTGLDHWAG